MTSSGKEGGRDFFREGVVSQLQQQVALKIALWPRALTARHFRDVADIQLLWDGYGTFLKKNQGKFIRVMIIDTKLHESSAEASLD